MMGKMKKIIIMLNKSKIIVIIVIINNKVIVNSNKKIVINNTLQKMNSNSIRIKIMIIKFFESFILYAKYKVIIYYNIYKYYFILYLKQEIFFIY